MRGPPGNATVEVDGQRAEGVSPMRLKLDPGEHLIVAHRDGFLETRERVEVRSIGTTAVDLTLRPLLGLVLVDSLPEDADAMNRVYVRSGVLDQRRLLDSLEAGRSFATNGPLLQLSVENRGVGQELALPAGEHEHLRRL